MELNFSLNSIDSKILTGLQNRGFSYVFNVANQYICCDHYTIPFEEFDIVEVHSMETSSAADNYILYAVKCDKLNVRGIIRSSFSTYANGFSNTCINKILNHEQIKFGYHKVECIKKPRPKVKSVMYDT